MPTVPTVNTKTTSDVDTEISGSNEQLELNSDSNAQQTELTTCINASLINCLEQKQIPTITTDPVSCSITKPNSVFSAPVNNLNLPFIEFPRLKNNTERKDQPKMLQTPFWQGTLSHPTHHQTNPQVRMKRIVNESYQRMKPTANEWKRYLRYVRQTIGY